MYEIELNVPVPTKRNRVGAPTVYPLAAMQIGDSFLVPLDTVTLEDRRRVGASVAGYARRHKAAGVTFMVRTVEGGLRVWRTA